VVVVVVGIVVVVVVGVVIGAAVGVVIGAAVVTVNIKTISKYYKTGPKKSRHF
jgi:5-bromo-4-chloroindolyl phosphate hydrolysis protein